MNRSIRAFAAAAALLAGPFFCGGALAGAPMVKTQAPGYYRHMLGDFEVTALLDATTKLPALKLLTNARPEQLAAALKRGYLKEQVETSVNAYLVNTGSKLVLIDTGSGGLFGAPSALLDNLRAAGYQPEQVAMRRVAWGKARVACAIKPPTSHVSFPGLGHLRPAPAGKGFTWLPLNYSTLKE